MKNITNIFLGLILITLLFLVYFQGYSRVKFETKIVGYSDYELTNELSNDSENGWQIVGSRRAIDSNKDGMYELIMQRKVITDIIINWIDNCNKLYLLS